MSQLRRYRDRHEFFTKFIFDDVYFFINANNPHFTHYSSD
jgi:hypothetical protein